MIRFELEIQMLEGKLAIKDLPEAWQAAYQSDLGIALPSDVDGCLQDVHWYAGQIGGVFQGYTLGNVLSAQFYAEALKSHPEIRAEIGQGQFGTLQTWLKDNIYRYGSKYTAPELIERVTGRGLDIRPYIQYLRAKYGELYKLKSKIGCKKPPVLCIIWPSLRHRPMRDLLRPLLRVPTKNPKS